MDGREGRRGRPDGEGTHARGERGGRAGGFGGRRRRGQTEEAPRSAMPTSALRGPARWSAGRGGEEEAAEQEPSGPARIKVVEEHSRKAGRYTVRLEGVRSATVSAELVERLGLRAGVVLDAAQVKALREAAAGLRTYDRALNLLAFRARSSADLRRKLVEKGEPGALADQAIEKLKALGLLDDEAYARQVARGKLLGGASKRRVQQELWRRGVTRDVADGAMQDVVADEEVDEEQSAVTVARRKAASLAKLDAPTRRRRLYGFLARRGYDHAAIRAALAEVLDASEVEELDEEAATDD
jgi:regulatory protein